MLAYAQTRGKGLSSTAPAHRMCQTSSIGFTFRDAGTRGEDLSSAAPAHRMCQISFTGFTFWDAGLHPDER
jgi:hypothetical protein